MSKRFKKFRRSEDPNTVYFDIQDNGDSGIALVILDANGEVISNGYVLSILRDGKLYVHCGISENSGLTLDKNGKIIESDTLYLSQE